MPRAPTASTQNNTTSSAKIVGRSALGPSAGGPGCRERIGMTSPYGTIEHPDHVEMQNLRHGGPARQRAPYVTLAGKTTMVAPIQYRRFCMASAVSLCR